LALDDLKIAVTGAAGRTGQAVRTILAAEHRVPADKVRLLEHGGEEAIISEYAGQATLIGALEPEALEDRDLVFLCGSAAESAGCLLWQRKQNSLFVDLSGAAAARGEAPVVNLAVEGTVLAGRPATVAAPHALSYALSTLLAPIEAAAGVASTVAVLHRPAADFGEAGLEELHKQTVSLLNFGEVPKQTYGRQIAFNLVPQTLLDEGDGGEPGLDARVGGEIRRVLGWPTSRAAVRVLIAPVFHGHTGLVHVKPSRKMSMREVADALKGVKGVAVTGSARAAPTPVEIAERPELVVVSVAPDGGEEGDFWIWFAGGDLPTHAARNAVEIAARALGG
jgi:aspartate-semialdehyde dehydrogenase